MLLNPRLIFGPPGCGKTTTLIGIVEDSLARGVSPNRIGYVSFTTRAANEASERAQKRFDLRATDLPWFRTLHSLCFRRLGLQSSMVLEGTSLEEFSKYIGIKITGRWSEDGTMMGFDAGDRILFMVNLARVRGVPLRRQYDMNDDGLLWRDVERVAKGLEEFKRERGLVDYTDLLQMFVEQRLAPPLDELLVDEAQDLSALQWEVVRQLAQGCKQVTVAGDDDQAIYRWAGADVDQFINMRGRASVLHQSYRVPAAVQEVSNRIISDIKTRRPKEWSPRPERGGVGRAPDVEALELPEEGSILVLARNQYLIREQVEPELKYRGIIYERQSGHTSVPRDTLRAIVAWEALRRGEVVDVDEVRRAYKYMSVGVGVARGYKTLSRFEEGSQVGLRDLKEAGGLLREDIWHDALDRLPKEDLSYLLSARRRGEKLQGKPRVRTSTIHGAKGGEADHVILLTEMAFRTHREMEAGGREDEARVWYVGVTRAKQSLTLVSPSTRQFYPL